MRDLLMNFSLGARIGMIVGIVAALLGAGVAIAAAGLPGAILVVVVLGVTVVVFWIVLAPQARRNKLAHHPVRDPSYQPGVRLPVRVDPADQTKVAVD
jgi:uncharacterized membrane protein YkgB